MSVFDKWTCVFAGKMGLSWKRAWNGVGTKEEAEGIAQNKCNVVAIPLQLFNHIKEMERRVVEAEGKLRENMPAVEKLPTTPDTPPGWFVVINRQEGVIAVCGPPKSPGEVGKGGVVRIEDLPAMYLEVLSKFDEQSNGANICAREILKIIQTGEHHGPFGNPELEECAQAILELQATASRLHKTEDKVRELRQILNNIVKDIPTEL